MPPRTRSRATATKTPVPTTERVVKSGATNKPATKSTPKAPPRKKARGNLISTDKPSNGLVLHFANLPLELLLEIAKYLHPLDLIHLSRSNKLLRNMFMRQRAADVWRAVLANTNLPPCPDSTMPEPRYAALMFLEQCTECCKPATYHVDPILLVRLCHKCRKLVTLTYEEVGDYHHMIPRSEFLIPAREEAATSYRYLKKDYEDVLEQALQIRTTGGRGASKAWIAERKKFTDDWHKRALPLVRWVTIKERKYKAGLQMLRVNRAEAIEARLLELGWDLNDIQQADSYSKKWKPFVGKTKPLGEKEWNNALPHLVGALEIARRGRLRAEAGQRKASRLRIVQDWLFWSPDAKVQVALCWKDSNKGLASGSLEAVHAPIHSEGSEKLGPTVTIDSYPLSDLEFGSGQPDLKALLNQDRSMEEFRLEFRDKRDSLTEQLFKTWRPKIEADLVKTLPEDLVPADIDGLDFYLQAHFGTDDELTVLDNRLSLDLRKLLRADVRLRYQYSGKSVYYPDGLPDWMLGGYMSAYDPKSSAVAKALLGAIQLPNASYLQVQALGQLFTCGRCTRESQYYEWEGIVMHYIKEDDDWEMACRWNDRASREGKGITLAFVHDIEKIDAEKPLVRLVSKQDQLPRTESPDRSRCELCYSIGCGYQTEATHIASHIREVHSVEHPVLGEHYSNIA